MDILDMKYIRSKRRLKSSIIPILQKAIDDTHAAVYLEPFGGGANVIDDIRCEHRLYYDSHPYLVAMWKHIQETTEDIPLTISKEEYYAVKDSPQDYPDWYIGLVGFCGSFGAGWWNGFANPYHDSKNYDKIRDFSNESIRNILKQAPKLKDVVFTCSDFLDIEIPKGAVVYCDPPYLGTRKYKNELNFPYDEYYDWCRNVSKKAKIFMSEAWMPDDFKIIWEKELRQQLDKSNRKYRPERLYTL